MNFPFIIARHSEATNGNGIPIWWKVNTENETAEPWDGPAPPVPTDPLFPDRESALAGAGDIRIHYKGGIYRKICEVTDNITSFALYEHLHPNHHGYYLRPAAMFEDEVAPGVARFRVKPALTDS